MPMPNIPFRVHPSGWIATVLCFLLGIWVDGRRLGPLFGALLIASLLLHEAGHMLAAVLLRVPVREFGLRALGAYTRRAQSGSRRDEILIAAAGPLINLLVAIPLFFGRTFCIQLALGNLALCVVNLIPLPSSDGLRILRAVWRPSTPAPLVPALSQPPSQ